MHHIEQSCLVFTPNLPTGAVLKSFRRRIAVLLILANLPAVLVAVVASMSSYGESRALQELAVRQATAAMASRTAEVLGVARATLRTLASDPALGLAGPACRDRLVRVRSLNPDHSGIFLINSSGQIVCFAGNVPDASERYASLFEAAEKRSEDSAVVFLAESFGGKGQRVVATHAFSQPGGVRAALALTIDRDVFDNLFSETLPEPRSGAVLTEGGQILALDPDTWSSGWLPVDFTQDSLLPAFVAHGADNVARYYASMRVEGTTAFVLMARPLSVITSRDTVQLVTTLGVPLAMIAFGILAVSLGLNRFVLRWIRRLREATLDYKAGRYEKRIEGLQAAPQEIADLGHAFNAMVQAISERSAALEHALGDKNRILRELHHRVKNNFQMIASLLALQKRELPRGQQALLRVSEDRVLAMAAAHKASYALGDIGHVGVADLLGEVAIQVRQSFGADAPALQLQVSDDAHGIMFDLDRAVALSMLVSELVRSALEREQDGNAGVEVGILLDESGTSLLFRIAAPGIAASVPRADLSARLIKGYLAQLGAQLDVSSPGLIEAKAPLSNPIG